MLALTRIVLFKQSITCIGQTPRGDRDNKRQ
jgi:hypothetical protein